jgi:hypothetical protein
VFDAIKRIRLMYAALKQHTINDPTGILPKIEETIDGIVVKINTAYLIDETEAELKCVQLIEAIGPLKDFLKYYCKQNGVHFDPESVLDIENGGHLEAAIIHDLWNHVKHGNLNRPPRCGFVPKIANVRSFLDGKPGDTVTMRFSFDQTKRGAAAVSFDPSRKPVELTGPHITVEADVIDESNVKRHDFRDIYTKAVEQWEAAFEAAGITISTT